MSRELERGLKAARRLQAIQAARDDLLVYQQLQMPDPQDVDDVQRSQYVLTPQARLLADIIHKVETRELTRVAVSVGPQTGKSQLLSRAAPAWLSGRNPALNAILGSYNQDFANEFGDDVRALVTSASHRQVFPQHELRKGGAAKDLLITDKGGKLAFVGVGGSGTGKPADVFIVDDPIRNDDDAQSEAYRERMWKWFTKVANTRIHNDSAIIVVHCLTGDTPVTMADGRRKLLERIRPGDEVLAWDAGEWVTRKVLRWAPQGQDDVFEVRTGNSRVVGNARHLFLVVRRGGREWVQLKDLRVGDRVVHSPQRIDSCTHLVSWSANTRDDAHYALAVRSIEPAGRREVYDIQVEGAESFVADGMVVHNTRWHEDDLIGRLCDPDHPERHKAYAGIADEWTYINLPAVVDDPDLAAALGLRLEVQSDPLVLQQFGDKPMASLWPGRFSLNFLAKQKRLDKRGFEALRMGRPSPEDGDYFRAATMVEYHSAAEIPANLRMYGASDHAVSQKQRADLTVVGCIGVDADDHIWVMPDLIWEKMETPETVEALLSQFTTHKPLLWWMESELISKSFGPFLRKRMMEEQTYVTIEPVTVAADKMTRARAIQGRMSMKMVHFPAFAPWWTAAKNQMLKFPYGTHDDFVDWLAHIGLGLTREVAAQRPRDTSAKMPAPGTIGWTLAQTRAQERVAKQQRSRMGW